MAKAKNHNDEPPHLIVSRDKARQSLDVQIEKGRSIRDDNINSETELKKVEEAYSKWSSYNLELLNHIFSNDLKAREYNMTGWGGIGVIGYGTPPIQKEIKQFKEKVSKKINVLESIKERLELIPENGTVSGTADNKKNDKPKGRAIFIVHGHDEGAKQATARFIGQLELKPIILHEQPNGGRTIIEKFEDYSDVGFAVVLLTPDDKGYPKDSPGAVENRARQNVILELGYFLGKLGRGNVCALYKSGVVIPSDYSGVLYIEMDNKGAWRMELAKEIKHAGIEVDLNKTV